MLTEEPSFPSSGSFGRIFLLIFVLSFGWAEARSQSSVESPNYARKNTFSIFSAYSPDSSHILLGDAENRQLLDFGVAYGRRLMMNHVVNWQYDGEILPVALESDPLGYFVNHQQMPTVATYSGPTGTTELLCSPRTYSYTYMPGTGMVISGTETITCKGRTWNIGEGIQPVGFQWNFLPRRKLQPLLVGHGGYMYSTHPIPISEAGSFNFTFDLGAGIELFHDNTRSMRIEYRYHHISNHGTALANPGIDNGLIQVSYAFGR